MVRSLLAASAAIVTLSSSASAAPFRVLETDDAHVRIEFTLGAYSVSEIAIEGERYHELHTDAIATTTDPGLPKVPLFTTILGLPPGAVARLQVVDRQTQSVPGVRPAPFPNDRILPPDADGISTPIAELHPDLAFYDASRTYPTDVTTLGRTSRVRNQEVATLRVTPIQAHGGTAGGMTVTTRLVIDVRFVRSSARARAVTPMAAEPSREFVYRDVLNYDQAKSWRNRRAQPVSSSLTRYGRFRAGPEMKIRVRKNGPVKVRYQDLAAAGWHETPLLPDLVLTTRGYDASKLDTGDVPFTRTPIGIDIHDVNTDGVFNGSDFFVFYGQDARTQRHWVRPQDRYGTENVYWLSTGSGEGTAMAVRDATPAGTPDASPVSFESWKRVEEDNYYYYYSLTGDTVGTLRRQRADHLFMTDWLMGGGSESRLPFEVVDPEPGTPFGFRAAWRGIGNVVSKRFFPTIVVGTGGTGQAIPPGDFLIVGDDSLQYDSGGLTLSNSFVGSGPHEFVTTMETGSTGVSINWYAFGYRRQYRLSQGALEFTSDGGTGHVRFEVAGVQTGQPANVQVWDLTNPDDPVRLDGADLNASGGTYDLVFDDTVVDPSRTYLVAESASVPAVAATDLVLDTPSRLGDLGSPSINADYLIVTADEFASAVQPLVAWREGLGHRCEVARITDVYDEFSGGLFTPEAIREYVRYAYRVRPTRGGTQPMFLLLVGDGSEDYLGVVKDRDGVRQSAPTYVPVYTILGEASDVGTKPLIACDQWFIQNPDGDEAGDRYFSSMMVGRLPTASVAETQGVVQKILTYEQNFQADPATQEWRRRGLAIADDFYSSGFGGTGGDGYTCKVSETAFKDVSEQATQSIRAAGFDDFTVDNFFLSDIADTIAYLGRDTTGYGRPGYPQSCRPPCCRFDCDTPDNWACSRKYLRNVFNIDGRLIDMASRGHLFATYEGHGNRKLIAHEYLMETEDYISADPGQVPDGTVEDVPRLGNYQRWPIWFYFACHLAEFAFMLEAKDGIGDCMAERMLLHPDVGSIASVASCGFEWLSSNPPIHRALIAAWFEEPYLADQQTGFKGTYLGEILLGMKNKLAQTGSDALQAMVESYVTLGDPALRVDIAPPRLKVWQDEGDRPWELPDPPDPLENGTVLKAPTADTRETIFAVRAFDEVPIDSTTVRVGRRASGTLTWLPETAFSVEAGAADPVTGWNREWFLHYTAPLTADDYEIVFEATDYHGRVMEFALPARVDVSFFDVGPTGDERPLSEGTFLDPSRLLRMRITAPVGLGAEDVNVLLNGDVLAGATKTPIAARSAAGGGSFGWQLDAELGSLLVDGTNTVGLQWESGGGVLARSLSVSASESFRLDRHFVFPNPFSGSTDLFYRVTQPAREARLKIYTLSGRLIRTIEQGTPTVDLNRIRWDGRDQDGDGVANGVYFYHFEIVAPDGTKTTKQGKIARVIGHPG